MCILCQYSNIPIYEQLELPSEDIITLIFIFYSPFIVSPVHGTIFDKGSPNWALGLGKFEPYDFRDLNNCIN